RPRRRADRPSSRRHGRLRDRDLGGRRIIKKKQRADRARRPRGRPRSGEPLPRRRGRPAGGDRKGALGGPRDRRRPRQRAAHDRGRGGRGKSPPDPYTRQRRAASGARTGTHPGGGIVTDRPVPDLDAALVLGMASTAIPFANSREAEAERWLRILRLHGEAGATLQSLGVSEGPLEVAPEHDEGAPSGAEDIVGRVGEAAAASAARRDAASFGTADVLLAVIDV